MFRVNPQQFTIYIALLLSSPLARCAPYDDGSIVDPEQENAVSVAGVDSWVRDLYLDLLANVEDFTLPKARELYVVGAKAFPLLWDYLEEEKKAYVAAVAGTVGQVSEVIYEFPLTSSKRETSTQPC